METEAVRVLNARKAEKDIELEVTYNRWGEMTPEDGDKRLVIRGLEHDYRRHIVTGPGTAFWVTSEGQEGFVAQFDES